MTVLFVTGVSQAAVVTRSDSCRDFRLALREIVNSSCSCSCANETILSRFLTS